MKLLLDFGNTRVKVAVSRPSGPELLYSGKADLETIRGLLSLYDADGGMWCAVRTLPEGLETLMKSFGLECLSSVTPTPLKCAYRTPATLGTDRIAAAAGAWSLKPGNSILVIDAGTAITADFVGSDGTFYGGNIAPGVAMRLQSLHEHTGSLPLVGVDGDCPEFGYDTETAIRSGVLRGVRLEIEALVEETEKAHGPLLVFLTGGDAKYFGLTGKSGIFAVSNLVLQGLDCIGRYNDKDW